MECPICGKTIVDDAVYCPFCETQIEGAEECTDYEYEAFISYRHLPKDQAVATKLQKALEGFAIPKHLRDADGKRRLGKCFRDEDELPTSGSLSDQIENALEHSRFLIVVCTPDTRKSLWVQREVELFSSYHGRNRVLVALAEGEPADSFPKLLLTKHQRNDDGTVTEKPVEPMAADFRDLSRSKFSMESQRIAATIIGCNFDDLRQRARTRKMRIVSAVASGIAAVSIAFSGVTLYQQAQINENYRQIQISESEFLANESAELLAQGDRYQAVQVALAALPESSTSNDRPFVPAAQMALENALGVYPQESDWRSCYSQTDLADRMYSDGVAFNDTGLQATVALDRSIVVMEVATDRAVSRFDAAGALEVERATSDNEYVALKFAGEKVVAVYDKAIGCFDAREGTMEWSIIDNGDDWRVYEPFDRSLAVSPDGDTVAVIEHLDDASTPHVLFISVSEGRVIRSVEVPKPSPDEIKGYLTDSAYVDFSPDGKSLALGCWSSIFQINVENGAISKQELNLDYVKSVKYAGGHLTVTSQDQAVYLTDLSVSLEVFDENLDRLWDITEQFPLHHDASYTEYWNKLGVCGLWSYYGEGDRQYVALLGDKLLLLDVDTGEEAFRITCDSAFLDCAVLESCGTRLFFCTAAGEAACRIPFESNHGRGSSLNDWDLGTGPLEHASFIEADGAVYLSVQNEMPIKRYVYKHASDMGVVNPRAFETNADDWRSTFINESLTIVVTKSDVLFLDPATLETKATAHLSDIEGANLDDTLSMKWSASLSGDLYYMVELVPEKKGGRSPVGLYRIDGQDASIEELLRVGGYTSASEFAVYEYEQNAPMILIGGYIASAGRVILYDPAASRSEDTSDSNETAGIWEFRINDVRAAWYTGESLIAYATGIPDDSSPSYTSSNPDDYRFFLIDPDTDQVVDCDLSRYTLRSEFDGEENVSLSAKGKTLAVACSDGAIRLFDAHTGSLIWEARDVPASVQLLVVTGTGDVFVQDDFGTCMLLSGETGEVLCSSTTPLPRLTSTATRTNNTLLASFKDPGMGGKHGMAIVSLDRDAFGPLSIFYDCMFATNDDSKYMYENKFLGECMAADRLSLDELIERANTLVEGHELTEAERHMYRVND